MSIALLRGKYAPGRLLSSRVLFLVTLWVCFVLSYLFGPYTDAPGPFRFADPGWVLSVLNKMFLLCLLACLLIDDTIHAKLPDKAIISIRTRYSR